MSVDCTGTREWQANLGVRTTPIPCFCEKSPQPIENKWLALQKASKSSGNIDMNRDKPKMFDEDAAPMTFE